MPRACVSLFAVVLAANVLIRSTVEAEQADTPHPATLKTWPSPDGNAKVVWERIGPMDGPTEQYALMLVRLKSSPVRLEAFDRSVEVNWSSDSRTIMFTDYIGSNVADCYIVDANNPDKRVDIADLLPRHPDFKDAHVYVTCEGWRNPREVNVHVYGHTDIIPITDFDYRYTYDLSSERLREQN